MTHKILVLALALVPVTLGAQALGSLGPDVRQYDVVPEQSVALTNVRIVDGTGAAPVEAATIVIQNGKIVSVGPSAQAKVPAGARTMDLTGHTVIPGLVGMHNHTFYTTRGRSVQLQFSAPRLYLGSGLTTVRTTGGTSGSDARRLAVETPIARTLPARIIGKAGPRSTNISGTWPATTSLREGMLPL